MRLKIRSRGPHWKSEKINFEFPCKHAIEKSRQNVFKLKKNIHFSWCLRAALDLSRGPHVALVFETRGLEVILIFYDPVKVETKIYEHDFRIIVCTPKLFVLLICTSFYDVAFVLNFKLIRWRSGDLIDQRWPTIFVRGPHWVLIFVLKTKFNWNMLMCKVNNLAFVCRMWTADRMLPYYA